MLASHSVTESIICFNFRWFSNIWGLNKVICSWIAKNILGAPKNSWKFDRIAVFRNFLKMLVGILVIFKPPWGTKYLLLPNKWFLEKVQKILDSVALCIHPFIYSNFNDFFPYYDTQWNLKLHINEKKVFKNVLNICIFIYGVNHIIIS